MLSLFRNTVVHGTPKDVAVVVRRRDTKDVAVEVGDLGPESAPAVRRHPFEIVVGAHSAGIVLETRARGGTAARVELEASLGRRRKARGT